MRMSVASASSRAGIRPVCSASRRAAHDRDPSRLMSQAPRTLAPMSSRMVHQGPMTWPTWMSTNISTSGTTTKATKSSQPGMRTRLIGYAVPAGRGRAGHDARAAPTG